MKQQNKKRITAFVPYRKSENSFEFYLQKRDEDAPTTPRLFNFFGGSVEDEESFEQGVLREIMEELVYKPDNLRLFSLYETARTLRHIYIEEVGQDFESRARVQEGEYGKFRLRSEIEFASDTVPFVQVVIHDLCKSALKE